MLRDKIYNSLADHFRENFWIYVVTLLFIFIGIVLGIYSVKYINSVHSNELLNYFNNFINHIGNNNIEYKIVFYQILKNNIPTIFIIWFLGMTLVGLPGILIIDILKGYTFGFTISFLINSNDIKGLWMVLLALIPQNIIYISCILVASVLAMDFSLNFVKERVNKTFGQGLGVRILYYSLSFIFIISVMFVGFFMETYVTPSIMKILF
ncbi:stage II sporulation protein M [Clostridium tetani]|uniref:stage II sporulation protein M n=1 Tax=Clostridium tetani TaxID=1513 RepID=UPI002953D875|nr:stage II sporulation protein M [Clostridium tetani]BDR72738.1 stage II sporulation protein M [Clostridium tetani]